MSKLYFYYGVVGSAKTTQLLTTAFQINEKILNGAVLLSPSLDTRDSGCVIKSRTGISKECVKFNSEANLYDSLCLINAPSNTKVFLIDEIQFCKKEQINQLAKAVDARGFTIMCYGLKSDFRGELFEGSKRLLELADKIEEIKTNCRCGRKATMNARLVDNTIQREGPQILIGDTVGHTRYEGMCRTCWGAE